jgi:alpha-L-rhamnosidase
VTTDWNGAAHRFTVTTPPNTTANVVLPNGKSEQAGSGTHVYSVR